MLIVNTSFSGISSATTRLNDTEIKNDVHHINFADRFSTALNETIYYKAVLENFYGGCLIFVLLKRRKKNIDDPPI